MKTELSLRDVLAQLTAEGLLTKPVEEESLTIPAEADQTHGT